MHVLNRAIDQPNLTSQTTSPSETSTEYSEAEHTLAGRQQLADIKEVWNEMTKLNHPFVLKYITNGESIDRLWLLYSHPPHSSLASHISSLLKRRLDDLALDLLDSCAAGERLPVNFPEPIEIEAMDSLLDYGSVRHIAIEMVLLTDYLHSRGLIATNLDVNHLHLTESGHILLVDFLLPEYKDGLTLPKGSAIRKRREKQEEKYWS